MGEVMNDGYYPYVTPGLAETAALLVLQKRSVSLSGSRGRKIKLAERRQVISLIDKACAAGARLSKVCDLLDLLSTRTIQRWRENGGIKTRWPATRREVLHSDRCSPMKGATMLAALQRLGVMPSFSRLKRLL